MIIFYQKSTGRILGTVEGRVHSEKDIKSAWIQPSNVDKKDIVKYVVPYKPVKHMVKQPVIEWRMVDEKTKRVRQVLVGHKKVEKTKELAPDGVFAKAITEAEQGKKKLLKRKVITDLQGNIKHIK
jgi:hypothetical protein|tara:strand:- start:3443 stop:3820 length:378 start_codon:yes stop_codon:yes gene_type:complete